MLKTRSAFVLAAACGLARNVVRVLGRSLRLVEINRAAVEPLWAAGRPTIYAVWHGRMLMLPYFYGRRLNVHVLASRSRDGEIVSRFVRGFGFAVVRGSSSAGGTRALRALARVLTIDGSAVAIVPDGPRGPRWVAQAGPVLLARLSGAPIVPVGFGVSRGTILRSWDAFLLPHPFARAVVVFGQPLSVPAHADRGGIEAHRRELERALIRATEAADRAAGAPGVSPL
jgi:lysophospholipid acyltransferase (LPLAT)-like uncharacterized protein